MILDCVCFWVVLMGEFFSGLFGSFVVGVIVYYVCCGVGYSWFCWWDS